MSSQCDRSRPGVSRCPRRTDRGSLRPPADLCALLPAQWHAWSPPPPTWKGSCRTTPAASRQHRLHWSAEESAGRSEQPTMLECSLGKSLLRVGGRLGKQLCVGVLWVEDDVVGRSALDDLAPVHHENLVGKVTGGC